MLLSKRLKFALALWFGIEALVFMLVVQWIGVFDTVLLGLLTSLLGVAMLKSAGRSALAKLRATLNGRGIVERPAGHLLDETLAAVGALALMLPGFLSDIIGLALAVPILRRGIAGWIHRGGLTNVGIRRHARQGPTTIDLDPDDYRRTDAAPRAVPKA